MRLHNYHDTHAWFPPGVLANNLNAGTTPPANMSWMPMLLPFIEQSALYDQLLPYMVTRASSNFPSELMNSVIPPLMCPSDPAAPKTGLIHGGDTTPDGSPPDYNDGFSGNYLLCHGSQLVTQNNTPATPDAAFGHTMNGMFFYKSRIRMASVTDGTANTVMGAEIITLPELTTGHRDWRGRYYRAEHLSSIFSTYQPPNTTLSDYCRTCQAPAIKEAPCTANTDLQYLFARSFHAGGVQAVLADASVRFVPNTIDTLVWRALGTREGAGVHLAVLTEPQSGPAESVAGMTVPMVVRGRTWPGRLRFCDNKTTEGLDMLVDFSRGLLFLLVSVALLTLAGCGGGGPAEYAVTGTVTFDGQPVEKGEIRFLPAGTQGTAYAGAIVNGKFECKVTEGQKRVEMSATREAATPAPDGLPDYVSYIPAEYNTQSTLTAEVKPGGGNTFTFDLKSQGAKP